MPVRLLVTAPRIPLFLSNRHIWDWLSVIRQQPGSYRRWRHRNLLANDSFPNPSPFWSTTLGVNGGTALSYIPNLRGTTTSNLLYSVRWSSPLRFAKLELERPVGFRSHPQQLRSKCKSDIWISQGGGGASNCFARPPAAYARQVSLSPLGSKDSRSLARPLLSGTLPDVSLLASPDFPGYIWCTPESELNEGGTTSTCAGGIFAAIDTFSSIVGGTSASAPVFAGIVTLLNQYVVTNGFQTAPGLGNVNSNLYQIATFNPSAFHQVTAGDNMVYCQPGTPVGQPSAIVCPASGVFGYQASNADPATGYNLVTGLGSVDANNLVTAWGELLINWINLTIRREHYSGDKPRL